MYRVEWVQPALNELAAIWIAADSLLFPLGVHFRIERDGSGYTVLHSFGYGGGKPGAHPNGVMLGQDGKREGAKRELPSLILESDIIDITSYSEVDTRNKIDAFIESLESVSRAKVA